MSKYFDRLVKINESLDKALNIEPVVDAAPVISESVAISGTNLELAIKEYHEKQGLSIPDALVSAFGCEFSDNQVNLNRSMDDVSLIEFASWLFKNPDEDDEILLEDGDDKIEISKDSLTDDQKKDILKDNGVEKDIVNGMDSSELNGALDATLNNDEKVKMESEDGIDKCIRIDDDDLDVHGFVKSFDGTNVEFTDDESNAMTYAWQREIDKVIRDICDACNYDPDTFSIVQLEDVFDDGEWIAIQSDSTTEKI